MRPMRARPAIMTVDDQLKLPHRNSMRALSHLWSLFRSDSASARVVAPDGIDLDAEEGQAGQRTDGLTVMHHKAEGGEQVRKLMERQLTGRLIVRGDEDVVRHVHRIQAE
eukprot:53990-Eustigmatos_ZCMA.PRE.2